MKKLIIVHPFLFAVFPILFLFANNREELVTFSEILLPLLIAVSLSILLFLLFTGFFKNSRKAGIFVSFFLLLFFSYGHIFELIIGWRIGGLIIGQHKYLLSIWAVAIVACIIIVLRARRDLENSTKLLNVISASLVMISLFNIGLYEIRTGGSWTSTRNRPERADISKHPKEARANRDIYYIVLDGYANPSTLKHLYNYDDSGFTSYLNAKGFNITKQSRCNYALTYLSLASSLNMDYLDRLTKEAGSGSIDRDITHQLVRNNKVIDFLKARGYKVIHFSSGWRETNYNNYADLNIQCGQGNEFLALVIQTTMLCEFEQSILGYDARRRVLNTFSKLSESPKIEGPKFVFAHILVPHPPYLFDEKGRPVSGAKMKMCGKVWLKKQNYLNQLKFVNEKTEVLIDQIMAKSKVPPIIVLQSDHGSASLISQDNSSAWDSPTDEMLKERMRVFSAFYLPDGGDASLYDSITPANNFRLIFNHYLGTDFRLLDDQSYFSTYKHPFQFINVTEKVKFH